MTKLQSQAHISNYMLIYGSNANDLISQTWWLWPALIRPLVIIEDLGKTIK